MSVINEELMNSQDIFIHVSAELEIDLLFGISLLVNDVVIGFCDIWKQVLDLIDSMMLNINIYNHHLNQLSLIDVMIYR